MKDGFIIYSNNDLTTFIEEYVVDNGFNKYEHQLAVQSFFRNEIGIGTRNYRYYHKYERYYDFIKTFKAKDLKAFNYYTIGIVIKGENIWVPLLTVGNTMFNDDLIEVSPVESNLFIRTFKIRKLLMFPMTVWNIHRKMVKCCKVIGDLDGNDLLKHVDKIINMEKLIGKL